MYFDQHCSILLAEFNMSNLICLHITRDICFPGREHISLGMSASRVEKQMSLRICVSQVGEHISVGVYMYVFLGGVFLLGEHIIITRDLCFPVSGTHVT